MVRRGFTFSIVVVRWWRLYKLATKSCLLERLLWRQDIWISIFITRWKFVAVNSYFELYSFLRVAWSYEELLKEFCPEVDLINKYSNKSILNSRIEKEWRYTSGLWRDPSIRRFCVLHHRNSCRTKRLQNSLRDFKPAQLSIAV